MDVKKKVETTIEEKDKLLGEKEIVEKSQVEIDRPLGKDIVEKTKKVIKE